MIPSDQLQCAGSLFYGSESLHFDAFHMVRGWWPYFYLLEGSDDVRFNCVLRLSAVFADLSPCPAFLYAVPECIQRTGRLGDFYRILIHNSYLIPGNKDVSQILYSVVVTITEGTRTSHPSLANVRQGS